MDGETIVYYEPDPVVSQIRELESTLHDDLTANTAALEKVYQNSSYNVVADLWISALTAILVGVGIVLIFKRK